MNTPHKSQPQVIQELRPGQSIELLKDLHILTREGKLNQDTRRKLKQVYHLYQFIEPLLDQVLKSNAAFTLADHGAGKSYLGFILYDLFFNVAHSGHKTAGHVYGIETRPELVEKSRTLAARLGFERMFTPTYSPALTLVGEGAAAHKCSPTNRRDEGECADYYEPYASRICHVRTPRIQNELAKNRRAMFLQNSQQLPRRPIQVTV